ncbi:uncharacterized protein LOC128205737 [Mya arenaria]|nr:uncharacterized protein LOC128205737 [Mya arenaria]
MPKQYSGHDLKHAIASVRRGHLSMSKAAKEFCIPRTTLHDHVNNPDLRTKTGPPKQLSEEDTQAFVNFSMYCAAQHLPLSRERARCFILDIVKRSEKPCLFNMEHGPSDEWFRKLEAEYHAIRFRTARNEDRSRTTMSNKKVMDEFFLFWVAQLEKHGVTAKPAQIFNCDETGWCGKEESKVKVIAPRTGPVKQRRVLTADHVTALLCVSADGKTTPPCIIYKESFPHRTYREGVPGSWLFAVSDTGYVNTEIFCQWFLRGFIPNCGKERPVVLLMDNHDSHISLPLIQAARANDIVLVGLPSHTTHLLQPLDVHINGPLKQRVSKICNNLGFLRPGVAISKAKLPVIISHALDQTSPSSIKEAFRLSGIFPVDRKQITDAELVPPTIDVSLPQDTEPIRSCHACGSFIGDNPLVKRGLVPRHLWDILVPPPMPAAPIKKPSAKIVATGRVISSDDILESLKAKETEAAERLLQKHARRKGRRRGNSV